MQQLFANNTSSGLTVAAAATDTTLTLSSVAGFPQPISGQFFLVNLYNGSTTEICEVVSVNTITNVLTLGGRGLEGTVAQAWPIGTNVGMRVTAGTLASFAGVAGNSSQVFNVANATTPTEAIPLGQAQSLFGRGTQYLNSTQTLQPGIYLVDTSAGSFSVNLEGVPSKGDCMEFIDGPGTWGQNNFIIENNGNTIMQQNASLICNVSGETFRLWFNGTDWRIE